MSERQEALPIEWEFGEEEKTQDRGAHVLMRFYARAVWVWVFYWFLIVPISSAYNNVRSVLSQSLQSGRDKTVESVNYLGRVQEAVGRVGVDPTWALLFLTVVPILGYVVLRAIIASVQLMAEGSSRSEAMGPTGQTSARPFLAEDAPATLRSAWRPSGGSWSLLPADPQSRLTTRDEWEVVEQLPPQRHPWALRLTHLTHR